MFYRVNVQVWDSRPVLEQTVKLQTAGAGGAVSEPGWGNAAVMKSLSLPAAS
jgi:hypothetical protein